MSEELLILIPVAIILISIIYLIVCKVKGADRMIPRIIKCVVAIVAGIVVCMILSSTIGGNAEVAKNAYPSSIDNISYGDAIDAHCSDVSWKQFVDDGTKDIVIEMNGKGDYDGKEHDITIQFLNAGGDDNGKISEDAELLIRFVGLDDDQTTDEEVEKDILFTMFQEYASENDIELDESQKEGILQTQAYLDKYGSSSEGEDDVSDASEESDDTIEDGYIDDSEGDPADDEESSDSGSSLEDYNFSPCYAGVTNSDDEYAYLGFIDEKQAVLVIYESDTNENICMAGDVSTDGDYFTLTDSESGVSATFGVEEQDDGSYLLDLGDDGQIYLEEISSSDFVNCLNNLALYTDNAF